MKELLRFYSVFILVLLMACSTDDGGGDGNEGGGPDSEPPETPVGSVLEFKGMVDGFEEASRLGIRFASADFNPTGFYAPPNTKLQLELKENENNIDVFLMVGTYSQSDFWNFEPSHFSLRNGDNEINSGPTGGMVYIKYFDAAENSIKVAFKDGFEKAALFHKNETTAAEWSTMLSEYSDVPFATLVGDQSIIVVSNQKATLFKDQDQNLLLNNIDRAIAIENEISGMDSSSELQEPIKHKTLFVEYGNTDFYMFAYNYRTAYNFDTGVQFVLDNELFTKDGWGPWHEIGHTRQMNAWTWNETVEVTVNIYSLAVEKEFGLASRFQRENTWVAVNNYLSQPIENKNYNGTEVDLFVRLGMFYQLQLAFGEDYYKKLHKLFRTEKPNVANDNDRMRLFMVNASRIANADLTDFFEKWGLKFDDAQEAYDNIAALNLATPENDLTLITD